MPESEAESQTSLSSPSQRFEPQDDDEETLWEVIRITGEKGNTYKVQWKGLDPKTQKPWPQSWVKKSDCTDDLVIEWKRVKKEKAKGSKKGKNAVASKKSGRGSTASTVVKGSSSKQPVASSSKLPRRSTSTATSTVAASKPSRTRGETRSTATATPTGRKSKDSIEEEDELDAESEDEPRANGLNNAKKRKLIDANSAPSSANLKSRKADDADEGGNPLEKRSVGRPRKKRKVEAELVKFDPEDEGVESRKSLARSQSRTSQVESYPLQKVRGKAAEPQEEDVEEDEQEERMVEDALSEAASPPREFNNDDDDFYTPHDQVDMVDAQEEDIPRPKTTKTTSVISLSSSSSRSSSAAPVKIGPPTQKRPKAMLTIKKPLFEPKSRESSHYSSRSGSLPSLQYPTGQDDDLPAPPPPIKEASVFYSEEHVPILSPAALQRLAQFDEEVMGKKIPESDVERLPKPTFVLDPLSALNRTPAKHDEASTTIQRNDHVTTNDHPNYDNDIVPETDESQSEELVLPTAAAGPSTPRSTSTNTTTRPGSLKSRMKPRSRTPSSPSNTSKKDRPLRPIPMLSPSTFHPLLPIPELDSSLPESIIEPAEQSGDMEDVEAPMSSIEEFDSPEKDRRKVPARTTLVLKGKGRERSKSATSTVGGRESASEIWDSQVVQRGQAIAEAAKKKNAFDVPPKPKRTVEEIQAAAAAAAASRSRQASIAEDEVDEEDEDMEDVSTIPVPPASGPPAVVDEESLTLQEMEAAYVDLSGGSGEPPVDPAQLRQEEEESTQDLMAELNQVQHQQRGMNSIDLEGGWDVAPAATSNKDSEQANGRGGRLEAIPETEVMKASRAPSARPPSPESSPPPNPRARLRSRSRTPAVVVNQKRSRQNSKSELGVLPAHPASRRSATPAPRPPQGPSSSKIVPPLEPEPTPSAPEAKSQEIAELEAQLAELQSYADTFQALRTEAEEKEAAHKAQVDEVNKQLADVNAQWASEKASWEAERAQLLAQVESARQRKVDADRDREFFREQYAQASGYVTSVREENQELEKRVKIAEEQTQKGVGLIKATFELRVKTLEDDAKSWRKMAEFLIAKDQRTDNDELRRRAAEEPELRARCERQQGALEADEDRIEQLELQLEDKESDLAVAETEIQRLRKETTQLHVALNEALMKLDRIGRAGAGDDSMDGSPDGHEFVYLCKWRPDDAEESEACREVFATISELEQHLVSAGGHLQRKHG